MKLSSNTVMLYNVINASTWHIQIWSNKQHPRTHTFRVPDKGDKWGRLVIMEGCGGRRKIQLSPHVKFKINHYLGICAPMIPILNFCCIKMKKKMCFKLNTFCLKELQTVWTWNAACEWIFNFTFLISEVESLLQVWGWQFQISAQAGNQQRIILQQEKKLVIQ